MGPFECQVFASPRRKKMFEHETAHRGLYICPLPLAEKDQTVFSALNEFRHVTARSIRSESSHNGPG